jgi:hypothetical protein
MFALISSMFSGLMSGLVGPLFTWLNKKQDTELEGFQTAAGIDQAAYATFMQYQIAIGAQKAAANSWWGARVLYLVVGGAAALHTVGVFLDSVPFWTPWGAHAVGSWAVPALPPIYADYEKVIVYSLFVVSTLGPPASAVTAWLHRK